MWNVYLLTAEPDASNTNAGESQKN